jgi:hypothetical protein
MRQANGNALADSATVPDIQMLEKGVQETSFATTLGIWLLFDFR